MALETATYISQLNTANPLGSDPIASGDDHIRLIKSAIKNTFPNVNGAVTVTDEDLNTIPDLATTTYVDEEIAAIAGSISQTGRIVQIVNSVTATGVESFSDSYVPTGHTAIITPQSAANQILVIVSTGFAQTNAYAGNASNAFWTLYRNSTNLGTTSGHLAMANVNTINSQSNYYGSMSYTLLDSPNTTSAVTYQSYVRRSGNASAGYNTLQNARIILLEIAQ